MKLNVKTGAAIAVASALAIAAPANAHPGPSGNRGGGHTGASNHGAGHTGASNLGSRSHRCAPHKVAYVEGGTVDSATPSTLAKNGDGTWSGTLVVDVRTANHAAKADRHQTVTYTFTNAKLRVRFQHGVTGFTAGERVKLIGKEAKVARKCTTSAPASTPVFRMVVVHPARS